MLNVATAIAIAVLALVYIVPVLVEFGALVLTDRTPLGRPDRADRPGPVDLEGADPPPLPGVKVLPGAARQG